VCGRYAREQVVECDGLVLDLHVRILLLVLVEDGLSHGEEGLVAPVREDHELDWALAPLWRGGARANDHRRDGQARYQSADDVHDSMTSNLPVARLPRHAVSLRLPPPFPMKSHRRQRAPRRTSPH